MSVYYDVTSKSLNKKNEELCGDKVETVNVEDGVIVVLSDGLGSGVKANILATLTSKIIATMMKSGATLEDTVDTIIHTLPVCKVRHVAYSTFSILKLTTDGKAYLTFRVGREGLAPLGDTLTGFEVAGADRTFHPATAWIEKGKGRLIVACDAVPEPVAVRYAFRNAPEASLFNASGIPVSSFRTDDWEVK